MSSTNILQHLRSITSEKRTKIKESLTIAGLMHSNGNNTKHYFRTLAKQSSGRTKKIYIAFAKAEKHNLDTAFNRFIGML